jgi:hypothetical protein
LLASINAAPAERLTLIFELLSDWWVFRNSEVAEPCTNVLYEFYRMAGRSLNRICRQNRILPTDSLESVDQKIQFATENQGVYAWAVDSTENDPPVYGRFQEAGASWSFEAPALSLFLVQFFLLELLIGAPLGASVAWINQSELDAILGQMVELPFPDWYWPTYPGRFFARGNALAFCCPNRGPEESSDDAHSLWVAGRAPHDVAFVRQYVNSSWEYVALDG